VNVGIFFKVANDFLIDVVPVEESEPYGDALQYGGHFDFHECLHPAAPSERRFKAHDYDYYPRGRVVYFPKRNTFTLYVDPCLTPDDIKWIINLFGLDGQTMEVAKDEHYRCSRCNGSYLE
jgi:hypothetical protein